MSASRSLRATLRAHMNQRTSSWSIGGYGAIAEFHWLPDDHPGGISKILQVVTGAGALSLELRDGIIPHAYQTLSRHPDRWLQGFSLCLPWRHARRGARAVLTELGPDRHAIRPGDGGAVLFDLGLGLPHVDACVRSDSPELLKILRACCGQPLLAPGNRVLSALKEASPHRVFISQLGRVEVYQPIGDSAHHPATPLGPHTHVLPRLLRAGRARAEDNDAPAYHRACATLYPKHPLMDNLGNRTAYDRGAHARFTALMERWATRPSWRRKNARPTPCATAWMHAATGRRQAGRVARHCASPFASSPSKSAKRTPSTTGAAASIGCGHRLTRIWRIK